MNLTVANVKTPLQVGFFEIFSETSSVHSVVKTHPVACTCAILSDILLAFTILVPIVAMVATRVHHGQWVVGWFLLRMCASHFLESEKKEIPPPGQDPQPPSPDDSTKPQLVVSPPQPNEVENPPPIPPNAPSPGDSGGGNGPPKKEERPGNSKLPNPSPGQPGKANAFAPRRSSLPSNPLLPVDGTPPKAA
ncbi:MAG: hypothetical protein LBS68_03045, partial [Puniceicoccales bacterium]|nr:hypothetical protein [Puniceicoccales bacterium]